ncbi:methyl-accepting chemotaxis protein [bacterium]|nr:methyl-accepting chemotaxis protein [bacterium]
MRFLDRISIKNFMLAAIGFLVLALAILSAWNTLWSYQRYKETTRMGEANELSDHLLDAAGFAALERGTTFMALSSDKPAENAIVLRIEGVRKQLDGSLKAAQDLSRLLMDADPGNHLLIARIKELERLGSELPNTRARVDSNIARPAKDYTAQEWFKFATSLIDAASEARLAAFASSASTDTNQEALRMNLEVKQAVWLMGEYSGRERATLAGVVSRRVPVDDATREKLNTFRAIIDINLKPVLRLKETQGIDPKVMEAVSKMEATFLGSFASVRSSVMAASATGEYGITGREWIEESTKGIDTILEVSAAVGEMVNTRIGADLRASKAIMAVSAATLLIVIVLGTGSALVIKGKVVMPLHYLSEAMSKVERTNDLTLKLDLSSEDESGRAADAFNRMLERFRFIVNELHTSIAQLASSSEELSATAVQIAEGSQSQSFKANQVSTAAQEMSATIIEVVKNVSGAAEAAREASEVAVSGGGIVSETIESMNGIAKSARESSETISKLGSRSEEIGNIISVINDIADQTNLLALNAAIEAARAGEQGRGFAVVADEVRKLAEKTMKATKEIGVMITAMQEETGKAISSMEHEVKAVEKGVKLATAAGQSLHEIVEKVGAVTSRMHQVAAAAEQQSTTTDQISGDVATMANVITDTSASAQQIARASEEIAELATGLKSKVEVFHTSNKRRENETAAFTRHKSEEYAA